MNLNKNIEFAKLAEGEVRLQNGNHKLYKCPGYQTIGYGYNIEANGISENTAEMLLRRCLGDSVIILEANVSVWSSLSDTRKSILVDMCFNMGWPTLSKFKKMFAALERGHYAEAADQMMDSKWYRQVGIRGRKLVESMRSDVWQSYK